MKKGTKLSQKTRDKMSAFHKGKFPERLFKDGVQEKARLARIGKKRSKEARNNMRMAQLKIAKYGSENRFWRGGITPINAQIRNSFEMKLWRESVFKRDNYTCIWCGVKSGKGKAVILHADHIKPFSLFPELRFAIDNGRTLCKSCHLTTDTFAGRIKNKDFPEANLNFKYAG